MRTCCLCDLPPVAILPAWNGRSAVCQGCYAEAVIGHEYRIEMLNRYGWCTHPTDAVHTLVAYRRLLDAMRRHPAGKGVRS